eukprot:TRINITY_DN454_c0_g1_i5.p1 TRINITY_DN454_c0_g1~~TRINITY_DN454_c0_g1_i5.p1  ORF type:complete len:329 (+),score=32.99 TRINITY_DN454_c0_g1_i5:72-1058(+)
MNTKTFDTPKYILYTRRYYILLVFSVVSCQQSLIWITFSPISQPTQDYYGIGVGAINLFLAWGCIIYCPCLVFTSWLATKKQGLRYTVFLGAALSAAGAGLRCLTFIKPKHYSSSIIISIAQILNAASGPMVMAPVSKLSATWFGETERTTATGISAMSNSLGSALGFLIGPAFVSKPSQIPNLIIFEAVLSVVVLIWFLIYFPARPPTPPSPSAEDELKASEAENAGSIKQYFIELRQLFFNPHFMVLGLIAGVQAGTFNAWTGMFDQLMQNIESQNFAGWLGFASTLAGIIGGVILGVLGDTLFRRKFKMILLILLLLSAYLDMQY